MNLLNERTNDVESEVYELGEFRLDAARRELTLALLAVVGLGLARHDEAVAWLGPAYAERDVHMLFLGGDPKWGPLRGDPKAKRRNTGCTRS